MPFIYILITILILFCKKQSFLNIYIKLNYVKIVFFLKISLRNSKSMLKFLNYKKIASNS